MFGAVGARYDYDRDGNCILQFCDGISLAKNDL